MPLTEEQIEIVKKMQIEIVDMNPEEFDQFVVANSIATVIGILFSSLSDEIKKSLLSNIKKNNPQVWPE